MLLTATPACLFEPLLRELLFPSRLRHLTRCLQTAHHESFTLKTAAVAFLIIYVVDLVR